MKAPSLVVPLVLSSLAFAEALAEYTYAPVDDAYVLYDAISDRNDLVIYGEFSNRCTRLKQVDIAYHDFVIVVQPYVEALTPEADCGRQLVRFQHRIRLAEGLRGEFMLHLYSKDGQLHRIIELQ